MFKLQLCLAVRRLRHRSVACSVVSLYRCNHCIAISLSITATEEELIQPGGTTGQKNCGERTTDLCALDSAEILPVLVKLVGLIKHLRKPSLPYASSEVDRLQIDPRTLFCRQFSRFGDFCFDAWLEGLLQHPCCRPQGCANNTAQ